MIPSLKDLLKETNGIEKEDYKPGDKGGNGMERRNRTGSSSNGPRIRPGNASSSSESEGAGKWLEALKMGSAVDDGLSSAVGQQVDSAAGADVSIPEEWRGKVRVHVVEPRDTLSGIALRHRVPVAELKRLNKIHSEVELFGRRYLLIPLTSLQTMRPPAPEPLDSKQAALAQKFCSDFQCEMGVALYWLRRAGFEKSVAWALYRKHLDSTGSLVVHKSKTTSSVDVSADMDEDSLFEL